MRVPNDPFSWIEMLRDSARYSSGWYVPLQGKNVLSMMYTCEEEPVPGRNSCELGCERGSYMLVCIILMLW